MEDLSDKLAESLNDEPKVFMECSKPEIFGALLVGLCVAILLGLVAGVIVSFAIGIIIGAIILLGVSYFMLIIIGGIRDKHHSSWVKEKIFLMKHGIGLKSDPFEAESRRYSRGPRRG